MPRLVELARLAETAICNSPSMPRRPIGSNCRSKSSARCWTTLRSPAGTASASRCRPIRSARWRSSTGSRRPPPRRDRRLDGQAGQGRLLGHRDQARPGARPCRLSGVHPQGDDRSQLHGLRQTAARARAGCLPQFATHNALTVASVIEDAGGVEGYEFQRLYGMGDALYEALLAEFPDAACRVYAPVGGHRELLAYLVRRLLENGANSSFVAAAADPRVPVARNPAPSAKLRSAARRRRAIARSRCRATFIGRNGAIRPASSSASGRASMRCCAKSAPAAARRHRRRR